MNRWIMIRGLRHREGPGEASAGTSTGNVTYHSVADFGEWILATPGSYSYWFPPRACSLLIMALCTLLSEIWLTVAWMPTSGCQ